MSALIILFIMQFCPEVPDLVFFVRDLPRNNEQLDELLEPEEYAGAEAVFHFRKYPSTEITALQKGGKWRGQRLCLLREFESMTNPMFPVIYRTGLWMVGIFGDGAENEYVTLRSSRIFMFLGRPVWLAELIVHERFANELYGKLLLDSGKYVIDVAELEDNYISIRFYGGGFKD